eukprot:3789008-Amphidinium_carterae.1
MRWIKVPIESKIFPTVAHIAMPSCKPFCLEWAGCVSVMLCKSVRSLSSTCSLVQIRTLTESRLSGPDLDSDRKATFNFKIRGLKRWVH